MLNRDAMSVVIGHASVSERGLWRLTSHGMRRLVIQKEFDSYKRLKPAEKLAFLCRLAILIKENTDFYQNDAFFKTQLLRLTQRVFPTEMIAAFALTCLQRVTGERYIYPGDLQQHSVPALVSRSLDVVAGREAEPCQLEDLATLTDPALAVFCARILGVAEYKIEHYFQTMVEGVGFHVLIKNHHQVLLPVLLPRLGEGDAFESVCRCIYSREGVLLDPPEIALLYIHGLRINATSCLSENQSIIALSIMLKQLENSPQVEVLLQLLCQRITAKQSRPAVMCLLDFLPMTDQALQQHVLLALQSLVAKSDGELCTFVINALLNLMQGLKDARYCAEVIVRLFTFLSSADPKWVQAAIIQCMPWLMHSRDDIREVILEGLKHVVRHITSEQATNLIHQLFMLPVRYLDPYELRLPLLTDLLPHMDFSRVRALCSQSLACLESGPYESGYRALFPVFSLMVAHPAIEREKTGADIARIMLGHVAEIRNDSVSIYTHYFLDWAVPLYDPTGEKFVLPFLQALFRAYHWTSDMTEESIPANLENAARYMVLHNELNYGPLSYSRYIVKLAPRLSACQAQRLWQAIEDSGEMQDNFVEITLALTLIEKLSVEQQQRAKDFILKNVECSDLEGVCRALLYLVKQHICSVEEAAAALYKKINISLRSLCRQPPRLECKDTKLICRVFAKLGAVDYLRRVFAINFVFMRSAALESIEQVLPQCTEFELRGLYLDLVSKLQGSQRIGDLKLQITAVLIEIAKAYPLKLHMVFTDHLFTLIEAAAELTTSVVSRFYKVLATFIMRLEVAEQTPYLEKILPLFARDTIYLPAVIVMIDHFPTLIAKLDQATYRQLLDTLIAVGADLANIIVKPLETLLRLCHEEGAEHLLQMLMDHPRAHLLCSLKLPAQSACVVTQSH